MFFKFQSSDIIQTQIQTYPQFNVNLNGDQVSGSVYLERKYLSPALLNREFMGYSEKQGGFVQTDGPFTASIDFLNTVNGGTNKQAYRSIINLYNYYSLVSSDYNPNFNGTTCQNFRVITIPEVYYDREIYSRNFFCLG
jgi:hypothetical protein